MKQLVKDSVLKIKNYQPGKPIEEVKRQLGLRKVFKLASNENPLAPSRKVISAITRAAKILNRYPNSNCFYLRKRLAREIGVRENQLVFGNGSDEIITLVARAFLNPNDEVVIAEKTFLIYEIASLSASAKVIKIPQKDFHYDLESMKKAITKKTKIVFIANPDNPTGSYITEKQVRQFFSGLKKDLLVYFDEAYYELVNEKDFPNTLRLLKQGRNIIITRTFSKAYSLAGLRIGYGISKPEIINYLNRVREPFNVNSLAQAGALAALEDKNHIRKTKELIREGKTFLYDNFRKMGLRFIPSATNFILLDLSCDARRVFKRLLSQGIIVRNMQAWGLKNFLRVTIGKEFENRKFISALKTALSKEVKG
jgi:histidinol-phosphate aminotransferase